MGEGWLRGGTSEQPHSPPDPRLGGGGLTGALPAARTRSWPAARPGCSGRGRRRRAAERSRGLPAPSGTAGRDRLSGPRPPRASPFRGARRLHPAAPPGSHRHRPAETVPGRSEPPSHAPGAASRPVPPLSPVPRPTHPRPPRAPRCPRVLPRRRPQPHSPPGSPGRRSRAPAPPATPRDAVSPAQRGSPSPPGPPRSHLPPLAAAQRPRRRLREPHVQEAEPRAPRAAPVPEPPAQLRPRPRHGPECGTAPGGTGTGRHRGGSGAAPGRGGRSRAGPGGTPAAELDLSRLFLPAARKALPSPLIPLAASGH